jgi:putative colanic acid biosynthesis glycosyltransferase
MSNGYQLSLITVTKGDILGVNQTLVSAVPWRSLMVVEQIVIDGDGAAEALSKASGCRWVRQKSDGIAGAFNEGLAASQGEWIWFLNGGDRVHPDLDTGWLLKLMTTTKADIVTGGVHYDGDPGFRPVPPLRLQWPPLYCWPAHPATLVRRSILVDSGGFDRKLKIAMDFDLWLRLMLVDPHIDVVSVPLAVFDVSGSSQRPEMQAQVRRETALVLLLHGYRLIRLWMGIGKRMMIEMCRACRSVWFRV